MTFITAAAFAYSYTPGMEDSAEEITLSSGSTEELHFVQRAGLAILVIVAVSAIIAAATV